ncbi:MAG TPA: hypothetical protein VMF60_02195, partial [Acidimicrobiales bacterium]|nr:hypothetical protein [Acidimicrobiales bacterium]
MATPPVVPGPGAAPRSPEAPGGGAPAPPVAPRRPTVLEAHGDRRVDDWFWLRGREDPEVLAHLRAENEYTERRTAHLEGLRQELFAEIRSRIVETDQAVPVRKGPWWYYPRTVEGAEYPLHCRLPVNGPGRDGDTPPLLEPGAAPWADEVVLLDENALAGDHPYLDVANISVSPGHGRLCYATDTTGAERFTLRVRDLDTGSDLDDTVEGTSYGVAWANDDATVFYTRPDAANRPFQLWRHRVGDDPGRDVVVLEEPDERFHMGVSRTKDNRYVLVELRSRVTSEVLAIPADEPATAPRVVALRAQGVEYGVEHHNGTFLLLTNDGAENFRVVAVPASGDRQGDRREVLAPRPDVRLEALEVFERFLVVYERAGGTSRVRVIALDPDPSWDGPLSEGYVVARPEDPSTSWGGANPEFGAVSLRFEYSSLVTPRSVFDLDMASGAATLRKRQPVLGGYEPGDYATERLWAESPDGRRVPMSVVRRRDVVRGA